MHRRLRPRSISLEASTVCQLDCPSCARAQGVIRPALGVGHLRFRDFRRLIDGHPRITRVELANWGEILLNPELFEICEYGYRRGVALTASAGVNLNTAGLRLLDGLVRFRFRHLTCAIDGMSQESYAAYRRKGDLAAVLKNILTINRLKNRAQSIFPLLTWQFVVFGHNEHEIPPARELARSLGMEFAVKLSWDESFSPIRDAGRVRAESGLGAASRSEYYARHGLGYLQRDICRGLWQSPQINWDGKLLGCCENHWGDYGNVFESGLDAVVNNEPMRYAREMLMGRVPERAGIPCSRCHHYRRMRESGRWMTEEEIRTAPAGRARRAAAGTVQALGLSRAAVRLISRSRGLAGIQFPHAPAPPFAEELVLPPTGLLVQARAHLPADVGPLAGRVLRVLVPGFAKPAARDLYRAVRSAWYWGRRRYCPLCGGHFRRFLAFGQARRREGVQCPRCLSLERHRLLWLYMQARTEFLSAPLRVLDVAPHAAIRERCQSRPNLRYIIIGLDGADLTARMSLTDLAFADGVFDCVLCSHVLEHVAADRKALLEIHRVLRPGGWAILQSYLDPALAATREDPTVRDPAERTRLFGQSNHMRVYGLDYRERLAEAGFAVTVDDYVRRLGERAIRESALDPTEDLYVCRKPG